MATSAPISAQPRAASVPMPVGPEAPVTTTTLPLRLKSSLRESDFGGSMGMMAVGWEVGWMWLGWWIGLVWWGM